MRTNTASLPDSLYGFRFAPHAGGLGAVMRFDQAWRMSRAKHLRVLFRVFFLSAPIAGAMDVEELQRSLGQRLTLHIYDVSKVGRSVHLATFRRCAEKSMFGPSIVMRCTQRVKGYDPPGPGRSAGAIGFEGIGPGQLGVDTYHVQADVTLWKRSPEEVPPCE